MVGKNVKTTQGEITTTKIEWNVRLHCMCRHQTGTTNRGRADNHKRWEDKNGKCRIKLHKQGRLFKINEIMHLRPGNMYHCGETCVVI